jgi:phenylacetate-coenzyme A ligase PaaK-like adenylate-forming protein
VHFPDVPIFVEYASMEAQTPIAESCWTSVNAREPYVHPIPEYAHVELIDPDTGVVIESEDQRGELVVTILRSVGFPLIRYRTGDAAIIVQKECQCGSTTPALRVEGRLIIDRLRFFGGELNVAEVDRVLRGFASDLTGTDFEVEYSEVISDNGRIQPSLALFLSFDEARTNARELATNIAQQLRVAPGKTYATGVAAGEYLPIVVAYREGRSQGAKRVRITHKVPASA